MKMEYGKEIKDHWLRTSDAHSKVSNYEREKYFIVQKWVPLTTNLKLLGSTYSCSPDFSRIIETLSTRKST